MCDLFIKKEYDNVKNKLETMKHNANKEYSRAEMEKQRADWLEGLAKHYYKKSVYEQIRADELQSKYNELRRQLQIMYRQR